MAHEGSFWSRVVNRARLTRAQDTHAGMGRNHLLDRQHRGGDSNLD